MSFLKLGLSVGGFATLVASCLAIPTSFTATWSGAEFGNNLSATATVMLDLDLLEMPGFYNDEIGEGPLTSLSMTVAGSANSAANRTYTGVDFNVYVLNITLPLDVSQEWIGQAQEDGSFFGDDSGNSEFGLYAADFEDTVTRCCEFTMVVLPFAEDPENDEIMRMVSFLPTNAVPEPVSLAVLGLGGIVLLRRRRKG